MVNDTMTQWSFTSTYCCKFYPGSSAIVDVCLKVYYNQSWTDSQHWRGSYLTYTSHKTLLGSAPRYIERQRPTRNHRLIEPLLRTHTMYRTGSIIYAGTFLELHHCWWSNAILLIMRFLCDFVLGFSYLFVLEIVLHMVSSSVPISPTVPYSDPDITTF